MSKSAKFLCSALVLVLMTVAIVCGPVHANSVQETSLSLAPVMYVARTLGEVFTVNIEASNVEGLRAFEFKLAYNTTLLDAVKVVQGTFFPLPPRSTVAKLEVNDSLGLVYVSISLSNSEPSVDGSGTLATVTFSVAFAPGSSENASCALSLYDTALWGNSMAPIGHDCGNCVYFWESLQADPPPAGRVIVLTTQKSGLGQDAPGGTFALGEMVGLTANVTYNGYPVQSELVAFEVLDLQNIPFFVQTAATDDSGLARANVVLSETSDLGVWKAFATTQLADKIVWTILTFNVTYLVPPHGPVAIFTENTEAPQVNETVMFDASSSVAGWNGTDLMPITEYCWDFGDGNKTTVSTPIITHAYPAPGIYYVTLTVYAPGASPETSTSLAQRKAVSSRVVGGYAVSLTSLRETKPLMSYSMLTTILATAFDIMVLIFLVIDKLLTSTTYHVSLASRRRGK